MNIPDSKQCTLCKQTFPITDTYWYRNEKGKYGFFARCKTCVNRVQRNNYDPEKAKIKHQKYMSEHKDEVRERQKQRRIENPEKYRQQSRDWIKANPEKRKESCAKYYQKIKHTKRKDWRRKRIAHIRITSKLATKRYYQKHPEKARFNAKLRNARKLSAEGSHTLSEIMELFRQQEGYCFHCGVDLIPIGFHRDHWIPLTRGGSDWISNIRLLCPFCNQSKHNKLPCEWNSRYCE